MCLRTRAEYCGSPLVITVCVQVVDTNIELPRLSLTGAAAFVSAPVCCVCFSRALRAALLGAARGVAYPLTTCRLWLLVGVAAVCHPR